MTENEAFALLKKLGCPPQEATALSKDAEVVASLERDVG